MSTFRITFELTTGFSSNQECNDWIQSILDQIARTEEKRIVSVERIG